MVELNTVQTILAVSGIAGGGWFANVVVQILRTRDDRYKVDRTTDAKIEETRDKLTLDLLEAARIEATAWREEVSSMRPVVTDLMVRVAHFEEALDHLHALLSAEEPAEKAAAERRARAFLRRMRKEPLKPELRNPIQSARSREELIERASRKPED